MNIHVQTNYDNDELYCTYSKEKIEIGEKYGIVEDIIYNNEIVRTSYKLEHLPEDEEEYYLRDE